MSENSLLDDLPLPVPPAPINWTAPFFELLLWADMEEEKGSMHLARALRWVADRKRTPGEDKTCNLEDVPTPSWDWTSITLAHKIGKPSQLPHSLIQLLPREDGVHKDHTMTKWKAYWTMERAYLTLLGTLAKLFEEGWDEQD